MGDRVDVVVICELGIGAVVFTCQLFWFLATVGWCIVYPSGWMLLALILAAIAIYSISAVKLYLWEFESESELEEEGPGCGSAAAAWNKSMAEWNWKEKAWNEVLAEKVGEEEFQREDFERIPEGPGAYELICGGRTIYVYSASNLRHEIKVHAAGRTFESVVIHPTETMEAAIQEERRVIRVWNPEHKRVVGEGGE